VFLEIRIGRRSTKHKGRAVRKFDFERSARGRITNMPVEEGVLLQAASQNDLSSAFFLI
jgi:hypothetical protein